MRNNHYYKSLVIVKITLLDITKVSGLALAYNGATIGLQGANLDVPLDADTQETEHGYQGRVDIQTDGKQTWQMRVLREIGIVIEVICVCV